MHPLYTVCENAAVKRGVLATIWLAQDDVLGRGVALKELRNWAARSARSRAAFRFAHLRRLSLSHDGLAPVHGADSDRGWLVLDYYPAGSLAERSGTFTPDHVRELLVQLLRTLVYLHAQGLVHGAVRPENLFSTQQGQVLLADGLGLRLDGEGRTRDAGPCFERLDPDQTKYLAPECLDGKAERVGAAADLYALGMTILELLLGRASFAQLFPRVQAAGQTWDEWQRSDETLPSLRELLPEAPADLAEVIDRLLLKEPSARPAAAEALAVLCPPRPPQPPPQQPLAVAIQPTLSPPPAGEVRRRGGARLVAGGVAVLALGVALGLLMRPGSQRERLASLQEELTQGRAALQDVSAELERTRAAGARTDGLEADSREVRGDLEKARAEVTRAETSSVQARGELARAREGAQRAEKRVATLEGQLGRVRAEAATQAACLVGERDRALADLGECEARAARQDEELNRARAELATSGKRVTQLEAKLKEASEPKRHQISDEPSRKSLVAALQKLGAKVEVDAQKADEEVVREVDFGGTKVTNDDLVLVKKLASLRVLSLASTRVADAGLANLTGLTDLRKLNLYDTQTTDAGLASLRGLTGLQTLCLATTGVSDKGLVHLEGLVNLQALSLTNTQTSDKGLVHLEGLVNLQTLHLSTTKVSDEGLAHLERLAQLRTLHLNHTAVSGASLVHLKGMPRLRELQLSYTQIGDEALAHLKGLASLEELDLTGTRVSPAALAALRQALPRCRIQH